MDETRVAMRRRRQLNHTQRRVAAVSFLSNVACGDSKAPRLDCLQNTEVLESYRRSRSKRQAERKEESVQTKPRSAPNSGSRERTPEQRGFKEENPTARKLSCRQPQDSQIQRKRMIYQSQWSEDGTLDSTNNSTPSHPIARRLRHGSSSESLAPTPTHERDRGRQISGTLSETSYGSSVREVTFLKAEDQTKILEERLVLITNSRIPFYVTSCIPYHKSSKTTRRSSQSKLNLREGAPLTRRHRTTSSSKPLPAINDSFDAFELLGLERNEGQEVSYCQLLEPAYTCREIERFTEQEQEGRGSPKVPLRTGTPSKDNGIGDAIGQRTLTSQKSEMLGEETHIWGQPLAKAYYPDTLDGWLGTGKHRTFLPFPSYITSVIEYVKPSDLKKELNEKFMERFPGVQLSLSKLRSIKLEMRKIGLGCDIDNVTIAMAYVYFEKLVLRRVINKENRKFCAGASLILSAKLNDVKGEQLKTLIERTETMFRLNRRDLLASEFAILVALEFSLHVPSQEVYPHYQRLLYQT